MFCFTVKVQTVLCSLICDRNGVHIVLIFQIGIHGCLCIHVSITFFPFDKRSNRVLLKTCIILQQMLIFFSKIIFL